MLFTVSSDMSGKQPALVRANQQLFTKTLEAYFLLTAQLTVASRIVGVGPGGTAALVLPWPSGPEIGRMRGRSEGI